MNTDHHQEKASNGHLIDRAIKQIRIVSSLGKGGMGEVYKGFDEKLKRFVAVKALHADQHVSADFKARFTREAEILSSLEHPNICRIYELVEVDDREFLVLELIDGQNLREAKRDGLSFREKLRIAVDIASVLKVTHAKQVVHRDLKPENIMLTREGEVKILDFGLAHSVGRAGPVSKASGEDSESESETDEDSSRKDVPDPSTHQDSFRTEFGVVMGTPGFLSPEQARGEPTNAASDMYSFGLLLHWLFSDSPIYAPRMATEDVHVKAMIGQTQAVEDLPSDLGELIERLKSTARDLRPTAIEALTRLTWIRDKPKRRVSQLIATAFFVLLAAGVAVSSIGFVSAKKAEATAHQEAATAKETAQLLREFLSSVEPGEQGKDLRVLELVEAFRPRLAQIEKPEIRSSLFNTYSHIYRSLGDYDQAYDFAKKSYELRKEYLGDMHPETLTSMNSLAVALMLQGNYDEAEDIYRECLELKNQSLGGDHADTLRTQHNLGNLLLRRGRYAPAEKVHRRCFETRQQIYGTQNVETLNSLNSLAIAIHRQGRLKEAEDLYRQCLEARREVLGSDHPDTLKSANNLALLLRSLGDDANGEQLIRQCLNVRRRVLGESHPDTLGSLNHLAISLYRQKKMEEAEQIIRQCLDISRRELGESHPDTLNAMGNLSLILIHKRNFQEAERLIRKCIAERSKVLGADHPDTLISKVNLAKLLVRMDKLDQAEATLRDSLKVEEKVQGATHPSTLTTLNNLAYTLNLQEKYAQAKQLYRQCLDARMTVLGEDHPDTISSISNLAYTASLLGQHGEAEELYRQCLDLHRKEMGDQHVDTLVVQHHLAVSLWNQNKAAEAERLHDACLAAAKATLGDDHAQLAAFLFERGQVLEKTGATEKAMTWYRQAARKKNQDAQAALKRLGSGP